MRRPASSPASSTRCGSGTSPARQAQIQATQEHRDHDARRPACSASGTSNEGSGTHRSPTAPATPSPAPPSTARPGSRASSRPPPQHGARRADAQRAGQWRHRGRHLADPERRRVRSRRRPADGDLLRSPVRERQLRPDRAEHGGRLGRHHDHARGPSLGAGQTFEWYATVSDGTPTTTGPTWTFSTAAGSDPVFVGAGDIADCTRTQDEATAAVIGGVEGTVWTTGDNVYPTGTAANFTNCYEPTGAAPSRPAPGPCPATTTGARAPRPRPSRRYRAYFGASATDADGKSYYSYDIAAQQLARRQPRQRVPARHRRLRRGLAPGGLARGRPRRQQQQERHRPLAQAALQLGRHQLPGRPAAVGRPVRRGRRPPARRPRPRLRALRPDQVGRHPGQPARRRSDLRHPHVHGRHRRRSGQQASARPSPTSEARATATPTASSS